MSDRLIDTILVDQNGRGSLPKPLTLQNYINGELVAPVNGEYIEIPNPRTGDMMFLIPKSADEDCGRAIASHTKYATGTDTEWSIYERAKVFRKAAHLIETKYWQALEGWIRLCMPKNRIESYGEISLVHEFLYSLSFEKLRLLYSPHDGGPGRDYCTTSDTRHLPWGNTSGIFPNNYPLEIPGLQIAGALACGNVMTTKPHEYASPVTQVFVEILVEAGMPAHYVNIVHGYGPDVSLIATDPRLKKVLFTGSSRVANLLSQQTRKVNYEQSGVNWVYLTPRYFDVNDSENLEKVAGGIAKSGYGLNGQRCSTCRLIFMDETWEAVDMSGLIKKWVEDNTSFEDDSLPTILTWSNERIANEIAEMKKLGIKHLWGGEVAPNFTYKKPKTILPNRFDYGLVSPALFEIDANELRRSEIAAKLREERFWGNMVIVRFQQEIRHEVFAFINSLPEELTCGIGTRNPAEAEELLHYVKPNGVVNVGPFPWTTGAEEYKLFGPVGVDAAAIGGSVYHLQRMWMKTFGFHYAIGVSFMH